MGNKIKPTDFETALDIKLDKAHASGLRKCDFVQVINTKTNEYLYMKPMDEDCPTGLTTSTTPICMTKDDFSSLVSSLQFHYHDNVDGLNQLSFDGVAGVSPTDFIDPNGRHMIS